MPASRGGFFFFFALSTSPYYAWISASHFCRGKYSTILETNRISGAHPRGVSTNTRSFQKKKNWDFLKKGGTCLVRCCHSQFVLLSAHKELVLIPEHNKSRGPLPWGSQTNEHPKSTKYILVFFMKPNFLSEMVK